MLNFLYCFDENYNIQALVSIYSLLENITEKINIHIIHKDPDSFKKLYKVVQQHKNIENLNIIKFEINNFKFPNVENAHVSEATYYRFFIEEFIDEDIDNLIYLDSDIICINNPLKDFKAIINEFNQSNQTISAKSELQSLSKGLELKSKKYFNAGVMVINTDKWFNNNIQKELVNLTDKHKDKLQFWDQDVLNIYFDGKYIELSKYLNFTLDMKPFEKINNLDSFDMDKVKLIHYVGKFKPWSLRGIVNNKSEFYQSYYRELFAQKYHLKSSRKLNTIRDLIESLKYGVFLQTKYPFRLLLLVVNSLIKIRK